MAYTHAAHTVTRDEAIHFGGLIRCLARGAWVSCFEVAPAIPAISTLRLDRKLRPCGQDYPP